LKRNGKLVGVLELGMALSGAVRRKALAANMMKGCS
jgi:hypothetical protein